MCGKRFFGKNIRDFAEIYRIVADLGTHELLFADHHGYNELSAAENSRTGNGVILIGVAAGEGSEAFGGAGGGGDGGRGVECDS